MPYRSYRGEREVSKPVREERARLHQWLLDAASASLASSLDLEATLRQVAHSAVPALGTWCLIDLLEPCGDVRPAAVAHRDPARERLVRTLREHYPFDRSAQHGLPAVLRTGRAVLYATVEDAWRAEAARTAGHLALMRELNAQSTLCAPAVGTRTDSGWHHARQWRRRSPHPAAGQRSC